MQDFRKLLVWQKAHLLAVNIGKLCDRIAKRKPGLAKQLERAADAIPSHIAEGRGRATAADFSHYLSMGIGSSNEVESHLERAYAGELISKTEHETHTEATIEVRKMLIGLKKAIDKKEPPESR